MPTLDRDATLHFDDIGEGPPVVFVHGITSTAALEWRGLVGVLADEFRCITPDSRGHGRSEVGTRPLRLQTLVDDLLALVDHLELDRPHLVGFSLGGSTVLRAILARPDLPASVTFIGYSSGRPSDHEIPSRARVEPPDDWPVALRRAHHHDDPEHWRTLYTELSSDWARTGEVAADALGAIACPVLVVQGEGEVGFKHRQAHDLAAVTGARVEVVAGGDHPIHQQQAARVNALVHAFVRDAERDGRVNRARSG